MAAVYEVTVTAPDEAVAASLAEMAVERRLAAWGQVGGPVVSTYRGQGAVETAQEWTVVFKTSGTRLAALGEAVRAMHPYDTPEFVAAELTGDARYLAWVEAETDQG